MAFAFLLCRALSYALMCCGMGVGLSFGALMFLTKICEIGIEVEEQRRGEGFPSGLVMRRSGGIRPSGGRTRASVQLGIADWPA